METKKKFHPQSFRGVGGQRLQNWTPLRYLQPAPRKNWPFLVVIMIGALVMGGLLYVFFIPPSQTPQTPPATQSQPQQPVKEAPQFEVEMPVLILWYEAKDEQGKEGEMIPFSTLQQEVQKVGKKIKKITVVLPSALGEMNTFQVRFQKPVSGKFEKKSQRDWEFTPYTPMGTGVYEISGTIQKFPNISLLCYLKIEE